jgi:tripartite ATP-independent transporter DctM subunit
MEALMPVVLLGLLIILGVPVAFAMGLASVGYILYTGIPLQFIVHKAYYSLYSFPLLAVPLFILAGCIMNESKITDKIFLSATDLVGSRRGGLGYVNVVASMFFAGMSGAALADLGGLGAIEIKGMKEAGYPEDFSTAITAASSIVGPIIPPSIPLVIYGATTGVSVGELFMAGFLPGLLLGLFLMIGVYIYVRANADRMPIHPKRRFAERLRSLILVIPALLAPFIIVGGIVGGIATPTEAASLAAIYAALLGLFAYRQLTFDGIILALKDSLMNTAIVMFICAMAALFGWVITTSGFTRVLVGFLEGFVSTPWLLLLIINMILLASGTIMESLPNQILFTPILLPIAQKVGVDPVHFGVIIVLNVMIGMYTPPVGVCLYMAKQVSGMEINRVFRVMLPWVIPLIAVLMIVTYVPSKYFLFVPEIIYRLVLH